MNKFYLLLLLGSLVTISACSLFDDDDDSGFATSVENSIKSSGIKGLAYNLILDNDEIIMASGTGGMWDYQSQASIIKMSSSGSRKWYKAFGPADTYIANHLESTDDGNYLIICQPLDGEAMEIPYLISRVAGNGEILWSKELDLSPSNYILGIHRNSDNTFDIPYSSYRSNAPGILVIDENGDSVTDFSFGDTYKRFTDVHYNNSDDAVFIAVVEGEYFYDEALIMRMNSLKEAVWERSIYLDYHQYRVFLMDNGNSVVSRSAEYPDISVSIFDNNGVKTDSLIVETDSVTTIIDLVATENKNIFLLGNIGSIYSFESFQTIAYSINIENEYLEKMILSENGLTNVNRLAIDANGDVYGSAVKGERISMFKMPHNLWEP